MRETLSPTRKRRLIRRLSLAARTLSAWEGSLRTLGERHPNVRPDPLLALLSSTIGSLRSRLAELGVNDEIRPAAAKSKMPTRAQAIYEYCLRACRACGRALGQAFRVAYAVADAVSVRLLYTSIRALEKQLWIFEPQTA